MLSHPVQLCRFISVVKHESMPLYAIIRVIE
jgi:hypothetical protein